MYICVCVYVCVCVYFLLTQATVTTIYSSLMGTYCIPSELKLETHVGNLIKIQKTTFCILLLNSILDTWNWKFTFKKYGLMFGF